MRIDPTTISWFIDKLGYEAWFKTCDGIIKNFDPCANLEIFTEVMDGIFLNDIMQKDKIMVTNRGIIETFDITGDHGLEYLINALRSDDVAIRKSSVHILGAIAAPDAKKILSSSVVSEIDDDVRARISYELSKCCKGGQRNAQ